MTLKTMRPRSVFFILLGVSAAIGACGDTTFTSSGIDDGGTDASSTDAAPNDASSSDATTGDADTLDGATGDGASKEPVAIVTGQNNPHDLIVSGGRLYWTNYAQDSGVSSVFSAKIDGSVAMNIASATHANRIASDGTSIFFTDFVSTIENNGIVAKVGIGDGTYTALTSAALSPMGIAVDNSFIYYVEGYGDDVGFITALSKSGADAGGSLSSNRLNPVSIAVDATGLAWTENGTTSAPTNGTADFSNLAGTVMGQQAGLDDVWGITMTSTTGYFTVRGNAIGANGSIQKCDRNLTQSTPVIVATSTTRPYFITNDGSTLFWTEEGIGAKDGLIRYAKFADLAVQVLASNQSQPHGIAVDDKYVYWTEYGAGNIWRSPKP